MGDHLRASQAFLLHLARSDGHLSNFTVWILWQMFSNTVNTCWSGGIRRLLFSSVNGRWQRFFSNLMHGDARPHLVHQAQHTYPDAHCFSCLHMCNCQATFLATTLARSRLLHRVVPFLAKGVPGCIVTATLGTKLPEQRNCIVPQLWMFSEFPRGRRAHFTASPKDREAGEHLANLL